jgi:hypothetical protein
VTPPLQPAPGPEAHFNCALAACAWLSVGFRDTSALRSQAAQAFQATLGAGVLKQADEQSLVALRAVRQALDDARMAPGSTSDWGMVASARTPGRRRVAEQLVKFHEQGAWAASPHIIPHCSLHSLAGLLSQALGIHGPNFGTGGMIGAESEAFWAAIALLYGENLPGVWVVLTGWDSEALSADDAHCQAAVLGLRRLSGRGVDGGRVDTAHFSVGPDAVGPRLTLETLGDAIHCRAARAWGLGAATMSLDFASVRQEAA